MTEIRNNFFKLNLSEENNTDIKLVDKAIEIIEKDKLIIIKGIKNIGKVDFIKAFINKTNSNNNYFYFNKSEDLENKVNNKESIKKLLNDYIKLYKNPKYIIIQNISKIEGIKEFLSEIYKTGHKILIVGNDISIGGIKEIEILNNSEINSENINTVLKYGSFNQINELQTNILKEKFIKLLRNDIFLNDIFLNFGVKSINLYNFTLTYLAKNSTIISLRDLQKNINDIINISLKTTIDYIDFSLQSKIIKRVYRYDLKAKKEITSNAKYYFTDNGIRNSLNNFKLNKEILQENLIFNKLEYNNYVIYSGLNGIFNFTFYAKFNIGIHSPLHEKEDSICIHISKQEKKEEIKKEVNKLLKIGNEGKKYLLVESLEKLGIKKVKYESVEIMEIGDFLMNFGEKK